MGRETKILLTLLGLLVGVFMGVVALKLFVPRPPEGTGPDIDMAGEPLPLAEPLPLVDPPELDPPPMDPPTFAAPAQPSAVIDADPYAGRSSRFGSPAATSRDEPPRELAVVPISYEHAVVAPEPREAAPPLEPPFATEPPSEPAPIPTTIEVPPPASPALFEMTSPRTGPVPGETYVTREGDSWWSLAEAAYGDGRLYRALYAWNRSLNERVSLVPGTNLDIPPEAKLGAAWSTLLPTD